MTNVHRAGRVRRRRLAGLVLAGALAVAACGGDDSGDGGDATSTTAGAGSGAETTAPTDAGSTPPDSASASSHGAPDATGGEGEPQHGGDVTFLVTSESGSLDPARITASAGSDGHRAFSLYGALVMYDAVRDEVVPILAESFTPNDELTTWTMTLKPDLVFSDGTPFDAEAVRFNWERDRDPANRSAAMTTLSTVTEMRVVDAVTFEVDLSEPYAHFDKAVSRVGANFIASPTAIESGVDLTSQAVGAGPFLLDSWVRDDRMVLRANPDWKGSAGPYVDTLTWRVIPDEEQKVDTFATGDADGIYSSVPGAIARALAEVDGTQQTKVPVTTGSVISFNASAPPFDDLRVRTAFYQAVDWQTVADAILGESAVAPDNFTIEGTPWYAPDATLPQYDVDAAQAAIDEYVADTGEPLSFQFLTGQSSTGIAIAEYVQTAMTQLDGVEVSVETQDTPGFITAVRNGDYQVTVWGNPMPEPEPGMSLLVRTGSISNFSHFSNPEIDVLIDEQRVTADPEVRLPLLQEIFTMLAHDLPYFPYMISEYSFVVNPDVHGIVLHEDGILRSDLVWQD